MKRISLAFAALVAAFLMASMAYAEISEPLPLDEVVYERDEQDIETLARCIYAEARGEPFEGQLAVASVILNRLDDGRWGDSVYDVICGQAYNGHRIGKQFAYWRGEIKEPEAFESCREAAFQALCGNVNLPDDVYYFQMARRNTWYGVALYRKIGCHFFYRGG